MSQNTKKYQKEINWINKKISNGTTKAELHNCVGIWSNKPKEVVMKKEKLTSDEYDKKFKFLYNVFNLLSGNRK